jgi:DNA-binding XRE family transcriptional regulator
MILLVELLIEVMFVESRLKDILQNKGIKQSHMVRVTGANKSTINRLVNKDSIPTLPLAYRIAKELNLHIEDIWYEKEI